MQNQVKLDELPQDIQEQINKMKRHRNWVKFVSAAYMSFPTFALAVSTKENLKVALTMSAVPAIAIGATMYAQHFREFKEEIFKLKQLISKNKSDPKIAELFKTYPYAVVDRKGNLVGKKNLSSFLGLPVGRRRVLGPQVKKSQKTKWKKYVKKLF